MLATFQAPAFLVGRILLSVPFILGGISKISAYEGTQGYMEAFGVPGALLPLVIAAEIGLGLAITAGFLTSLAAFGLAGFTLIASVIFHTNFADQTQLILFMKNMTTIGGFMLIMVMGAGAWSADAILKRNKSAT